MSGRRVLARAGILPAILLPLAGCAAGSSPVERIDEGGVQNLLADRAEAVGADDREAWLASVDQRSTDDQTELFDRLQSLGLQTWSERLTRLEVNSSSARAHVDISYRFPGDRTDARVQTVLDVIATDTGPRVAGRAPVPGALWQIEGAQAVQGERSIVVGTADIEQLERYAAEMDAAATSVAGLVSVPSTVVLVVANDERHLDMLVPGGRAHTRVAAVASALEPSTLPAGPVRILADAATMARLTPGTRTAVLGHEVFHVATANAGRVPLWLREGLADYAGYREAGVALDQAVSGFLRQVQARDVPPRLPDDAAFGDPSRATGAYEGSHLAVWLLAERYGNQRVVDLFRHVSEHGPQSLEQSLQYVLGIDLTTLTEQWRAEVAERAAG